MKHLKIMLKIVATLLFCLTLAKAQDNSDLRWKFTDETSIVRMSHLQDVTFSDKGMAAKTEADPLFFLNVPQNGIDAKRYHYLSVDLYSSKPADAIAVYYKSPNGDWGMGGIPFPIQEGWHHYIVDLETQIAWSADASSPTARAWGGTQKKIDSLRIDPGNGAGREIKVREIILSTKPIVLPPITSWRWNETSDFLGWTFDNFSTIEAKDSVLQGTTKSDSKLRSPELNLDAESWPMLEFRLKSSVGGDGQLFFRHEGESMSVVRQINFSIAGDNQFHVYQVNLAAHEQWKGKIAQIRFDPLDPANAQIQLDYLRFLPKNTGGLILNGGFESVDVKTAQPQNWTFENLTPKIVEGVNSLKATQLTTSSKSGTLLSALFEFPQVGQYHLSLEYQGKSQAKSVSGTILYYDIFHHRLPSEPLALTISPTTQWSHAESTFTVPPLAAFGQVAFDVPSSSELTFDNITLNLLRTPILASQERWNASWIIAPDAATQPEASRYYRKEFALADVSKIVTAQAQVIGDDTARLYINGHELPAGKNWNYWRFEDVYDVKPFLQVGKNVMGIVSQNLRSAEGAIAELNVVYPKHELKVETDKAWATTVGNADADWAKSTFDASGWKPATELGVPPVGPWGELPYSYLGRKLSVVTQRFNAPKQATLEQKIDVQFDFVPQEKPTRATALALQLVPLDSTSNTPTFDFTPIPLDTSNWKEGSAVQLRELVQLPRYLRAGEYTLKANLTFVSIQGDAEQRIILTSPPAQPSPVTKVAYLPGHVPAFNINGKIFPVMHTMTEDWAAPAMQKAIVGNSRDNNVNLIWLNIKDGFDWEPDVPASFLSMDKQMAIVLNANPDAYVVLNVPLGTVYNPGMKKKWVDLHPDQLVKKDDGSDDVGGFQGAVVKGQSYASPVWKHDAEKAWRELIRHVRSSSYADRVIGYVPVSGLSWEWFYWGSQSREFVDYSKPFTEAFAEWAKTQYHGDLTLLNKTWNTDYASFDAIQLPTKEQRMAADYGMFLNPQKNGQVIDLREFFTQVTSGAILDFCKIVKEETRGTAICGTYYGYVMYIGWPYFGVHSGHYALGKVLASPDIDFLMSPARYQDRGLGGGSGFMTTIDSIKLHGKLYIDQADMRTLHSDFTEGKVDTLSGSVSVLQREFANTVVNGVAAQWLDFGKGWIAGDTRMMQAIGKMWQIEKTLQQTPRDTMDAPNSIAVITNEKSILYTKVDSLIQDAANNQEINQLNRTGAAWHNYLLSDLPKLANYHCFVFLNCFNLTDAQKKYIDENLKKDGNVLVWINSPGIIEDGKGTFALATYDPNRVSEVTGFKLKQIPDGPLVTQMLAGDSLLQKDLPEGTTFGNPRVSGTRFAAQDGIALGQFPGESQTSLAIKDFPHWTSIYSATPTLPAVLLRNIATLANVPVINSYYGDITYVSKNLFSVHSLGGGERTFTVGKEYKRAKELFSDQSYTVRNGEFNAVVPPGGTVLFLLES
jgi:hypothetical protein